MKNTLPIFAAVALLFGFGSSAAALTINDPGVAGILEGQFASNTTNEAIAANQILSMGANQTIDAAIATPGLGVNCIGQGPTCDYMTGVNNYNGSVSGGVQVLDTTSLTAAAFASQFILAKFDGPNAGYVLFNTADWVTFWGSTTLPANGSTIWGPGQNGLSHYTYFGTRTVPDGGASLLLLGAALGAVGMLRRRMNV